MRVSELLRIKGHTLFTTVPGEPVLDAVKAMAGNDIGSLVVKLHQKLAGRRGNEPIAGRAPGKTLDPKPARGRRPTYPACAGAIRRVG